ncbi:hypothetical protein BH10PAT3_BH10PAT3_8220 [soil metagenome]
MSKAEGYVPYETLARAEADEIMVDTVGIILHDLTPEHVVVINELLADAYSKGLDHGFAMSGSAIDDPITPIEAYNAGFEQGKKEIY